MQTNIRPRAEKKHNIPLIYNKRKEKILKQLQEKIDNILKNESFFFYYLYVSKIKTPLIIRKLLTRIRIKHKDFSVILVFLISLISNIS
jgi:hypothetical protein